MLLSKCPLFVAVAHNKSINTRRVVMSKSYMDYTPSYYHQDNIEYIQTNAPQVAAPQVVAPQVAAPQVVAPQVDAPPPQVTASMFESPEDDEIAQQFKKQSELRYWTGISSLVLQLLLTGSFLFMVGVTIRSMIANRNGGGMGGFNNFISGNTFEKDTESVNVKFADVAGLDNAKLELQEIVDFLKSPEKYVKMGAKIPKGCLLTGGPGLGKTLLAKAVAGEAGVPFFSSSAAEFIELFVGVGASRIRTLFKKAKEKAPCIIFIDEIDAVGKSRSSGGGFGGNDEREQTINQLLTEMDGFVSGSGVVVIAATNRPDILDSALVRPGRFDRQITLDLPGIKAREAILKVHAQGKPFNKDVNMESVAKMTAGFSGAQLANLLNEAAILAARRNMESIGNKEIDDALEKGFLGLEKPDLVVSKEKKLLVAFHEAGHALVALKIGDYDSIKKVTIIPRGKAGGVTIFEQNPDRIEMGLYSKKYMENQLAVALGGRVAEELFLGAANVTTGAYSDLERVQQVGRAMVMHYGFTEKLGHVGWREGSKLETSYSDKTLYEIDQEVIKLSITAYTRAKNILNNHIDLLKDIAHLLIDRETISGDDILRLEDVRNNKR